MISENEAKIDTYFNSYCFVSLNKIKKIIEDLDEALNSIKENFINNIKELDKSLKELKQKTEDFFINKELLKKSEKKNEINVINDIFNFKPFYVNMISVFQTNINKVKKLKDELKIIMIDISFIELDPHKINSLNKESESESIISMSKYEKNESIKEEIILGYNDYCDDYINNNNNNSYSKSYNNTNNNVEIMNNMKIETFNIEINQKKINSISNILKDEFINKFDLSFSYDDEINEIFLKIDENDFSNKFFYKINLISKGKNLSINEDNIKHFLLNKLNIKENHIFLSFDNNFMETYIRTENFSSSSINIIERDYPDFNKLFEYKRIYDYYILKIGKKYFDYNGNTISPNSSFNIFRGKEEYDPPYGWFGIGLNIDMYGDNKDWIENKTNTSKWAIAYHGIGQLLSNDKVEKKIIDIIANKKLILTKKQGYKDNNDKRNPGKKIGKGFFLTPKIKIAEYFAGKLEINNKEYKVVLMARVLIEKIREPEDIEYWVLNEDDIRFYRILIKEIN